MAAAIAPSSSEEVIPLNRSAWQQIICWTVLLGIALVWPLSQGWLWFEPERLAPMQYYLLDPTDAAPITLARARSQEREQADILILGSSAAQESLLPPEQLGAMAGGASIVDLSSSGQNPLESLFLLTQAPLHRGQQVLFFVGPSLLSQADYTARLSNGDFLVDPLPFADSLPASVSKPSAWTEPKQRAALRYKGTRKLVLRLLRRAWPVAMRRYLYGAPGIQPQRYYYEDVSAAGRTARQATQTQRLSHALQQYAVGHMHEFPVLLQQIAARCRDAGARLTVLESPHAVGDTTTLYAPWWRSYLEMQRQSALTQGYRYVDLNPRVKLSDTEFTDRLHTDAAGRQRWSNEVATWLRKLRAERGED